MKFLNKLERKFGRYAIHNLMMYVAALYILGLLLGVVSTSAMYYMLNMDFDLIRTGQIWRIISWIIPVSSIQGILLTAISVYFYYIIGNAMERAWGAFRFNLYFFTGIIFNILSSFVTYLITGLSVSPSLGFICGTMFLRLRLPIRICR